MQQLAGPSLIRCFLKASENPSGVLGDIFLVKSLALA